VIGARILLALLLALSALPTPAAAERLVLSLSNSYVAIASNYTGTELLAFGAVERDAQTVARPGPYGVVLTVRGPREVVTVRRKEQFGPLWINRSQQKFVAIPALLAVYASHPLPELMSEELRQRFRFGLDAIVYGSDFTIGRGGEDPSFRAALIRLKSRDQLYSQDDHGVAFITSTLFRATVNLPATAPTGLYDIEAALLSDGAIVGRTQASFEVVKTGLEEQITELARDRSLLYGLMLAGSALMFGWIASAIFRRD
jgi:uncharacterized protein (TIGR02186 family)